MTSHKPTSQTASLQNQFSQLNILIEKLLEQLKQQQQALSKNDLKQQNKHIHLLSELMQNVEIKQQNLRSLCEQHQLPFNKKGMLRCIKINEPPSQKANTIKEWMRLYKQLSQLKKALIVQQKVVHHSHKSLERLIGLIKGQVLKSEIYQPNGYKSQSNASHLSAQA